jgi:hypothetical protein
MYMSKNEVAMTPLANTSSLKPNSGSLAKRSLRQKLSMTNKIVDST